MEAKSTRSSDMEQFSFKLAGLYASRFSAASAGTDGVKLLAWIGGCGTLSHVQSMAMKSAGVPRRPSFLLSVTSGGRV